MKKQSGFTMIELLISSAVITVIMSGVLMLALHGQKTHITENHKGDLYQDLRFIKQILTEKIRSAGAGISQVNLTNIEKVKNSYFLGIYPLNNANYPDGIIIASADPNVYSFIPEGSTFTSGSSTIQITSQDGMGVHESTQTIDDMSKSQPEWKKNDLGIVMSDEGYFVFEVTQEPNIGDTSLSIRQTPVYYSGLLNNAHYKDNYYILNSTGQTGGQIQYEHLSPIWKLDYFHIYLVSENPSDGQKILTLTTDTYGAADPLHPDNASPKTGVPLVKNIIDLQFEYVALNRSNPGTVEYWCSFAAIDFYGDSIVSYDTPCSENPLNINNQCQSFYDLFKDGLIRSIIVSIAIKTEELGYKQGKAPEYLKPIMGDSGDQTYHTRHYYRDLRFEVLFRNFAYRSFFK